jgi:creatinine amidohydrolase
MNDQLGLPLSSLPFEQLKMSLSQDKPVFIFVNPIEYHGPHLTLYTDYLLSYHLAKKLHQLIEKRVDHCPFAVWDTIHLGESPTRGPGSIHTSYPHLETRLKTSIRALAKFARPQIIFMTFHGAPLHNWAIQSAIDYAKSLGIKACNPFLSALDLLFKYRHEDYPDLMNVIPNDSAKQDLWKNFHLDFHGGFFESSLMLYLNPQSVSKNISQVPSCPKVSKKGGVLKQFTKALISQKLSPKMKKELELIQYTLNWNSLNPFPGYTLHPHLSNADAGEYLAGILLPRYFKIFENSLQGQPQEITPPMPWLHKLSLKGKIPIA